MNFFKIFIILVFGFSAFSFSYADNHGEIVEKVEEVIKDLNSENVDDEEVPLNDPFAGNEASSSANMNIPDGEQEDEMSLYNFKLAGLISGKDHSYISLVNSSGEFVNLTIGQFLGKVKFDMSKWSIFSLILSPGFKARSITGILLFKYFDSNKDTQFISRRGGWAVESTSLEN